MILLLLPAVIGGCIVSENRVDQIPNVPFNEKLATEQHADLMPLAPPLGPSRRVMQQLTAFWPGRQETLLCLLELDDQRIAMAGLTNDGLSLFDLTYDGKTMRSDKNALLPDIVAPETIIADLQLVYWPLAALKKSLPERWRLAANAGSRRLYFNEELRVDVHYLGPDAIWPRNVELVNHRYHYRLQIKTISYEALSE